MLPAAVCVCLLLVGWQGVVSAHPFHISTAEVEYDAKSQRLQVSLKLQAIDLEQALAGMTGERVDIEQPQATEKIVELLNRTFYLAGADNSVVADKLANLESTAPQSKLHWVGQELKGAWLWLYFELELPEERRQVKLFNRVLFETNESQINTVSVRHGTQRTTLKMTSKQPSADFEPQWMIGE